MVGLYNVVHVGGWLVRAGAWLKHLCTYNVVATSSFSVIVSQPLLIFTGSLYMFTDSQASLDEPTQTVVMHRTEPSPLQALSLQLSEKIGILVENNERMLEAKNSGGFYFQNKGI